MAQTFDNKLLIFFWVLLFLLGCDSKPPVLAPLKFRQGDKVKFRVGAEGIVDAAYQYSNGTNAYAIYYFDNYGERRWASSVAEYELQASE